VANTAKRVVVLVWMSLVTGKRLTHEQLIGATVALSFVLVYSVIDECLKKKCMRRGSTSEPLVRLDLEPFQLELGGISCKPRPDPLLDPFSTSADSLICS
jgi:hypothetical protein